MSNEQLPTSSSPELSTSSSTVQTENESSDGGSDGDDEKPTEQITKTVDSVQLVANEEHEHEQLNISVVSTITLSTLTEDDDHSIDSKSEKSIIEKCDEDEINEAQIEQLVSTDDANTVVSSVQDDEAAAIAAADLEEEIRYKNLKIMYEGRNILDFSANVANESWNVQYAHLPEKNYEMYINNRSQYNRLASGYEGPENYQMSKCNLCKCSFEYPVMNYDVPARVERPPRWNNAHTCINDLLNNTVSSMVNRDSPTQALNAIAQKMANQSPMIMNKNANASPFMHVKNPVPPFPYHNRNQFANVGAANNQSCFKHANGANNGNANNNAFYGNNISLNALVNQIGGNTMNNHSTAFNSMLLGNAANTNANNTVNNNATTNQLNNAALANFFQQNRQQLFNYGGCRQNNVNKSGINFNANSHKQMPTYSHF